MLTDAWVVACTTFKQPWREYTVLRLSVAMGLIVALTVAYYGASLTADTLFSTCNLAWSIPSLLCFSLAAGLIDSQRQLRTLPMVLTRPICLRQYLVGCSLGVGLILVLLGAGLLLTQYALNIILGHGLSLKPAVIILVYLAQSMASVGVTVAVGAHFSRLVTIMIVMATYGVSGILSSIARAADMAILKALGDTLFWLGPYRCPMKIFLGLQANTLQWPEYRQLAAMTLDGFLYAGLALTISASFWQGGWRRR